MIIELTLFIFKYKTTAIILMQYQPGERHKDQWNKIEGPKTDLHLYNQPIGNRSSKVPQNERIIFSTKGAGIIEYLLKNETCSLYHAIQKNSFKYIINEKVYS